MPQRTDPHQARARELCIAAGLDPDGRRGEGRGHPIWTEYRDAARKEANATEQARLASEIAAMTVPVQTAEFADAPLMIMGEHDEGTIAQMRNCMKIGNVVGGVICADGHLGYAQPVGGVIAYKDHISVSGVGFDIGCGNMAVRLDVKHAEIAERLPTIIHDVQKVISFGIGRTNDEKVEHALFDDAALWDQSDMRDYRQKAAGQLGTVGSGNHYVDILRDLHDDHVWIGVHFGSRGLGHTSATKYIKLAGGKDGINVAPTVLDVHSEIGQRYIAAMTLAGQYAYAGREWVVERVRKLIGGQVTKSVHNHHNFAWQEEHNGQKLWVVRKGATPAFPGQLGFVDGSMGDDAKIIEGIDGAEAKAALYSTVHGAGRVFGRNEAKRRFTRAEMDQWLQARNVILVGADLDESPMAYRRLPEVLTHHAGSVRVVHNLRPTAVAMAGAGEFDPFKD